MTTDRERTVREMIAIAQRIANGELGALVGALRIGSRASAVFDYGAVAEAAPFVDLWTQRDAFTVPDRTCWAPAFLAELDRRAADVDERVRDAMPAQCRALIAALERKLRECRACGFILAVGPDDDDGIPAHAACPCCAYEYGSTDAIGDPAAWREQWMRDGMPFRSGERPADWGPIAQMFAAGIAP